MSWWWTMIESIFWVPAGKEHRNSNMHSNELRGWEGTGRSEKCQVRHAFINKPWRLVLQEFIPTMHRATQKAGRYKARRHGSAGQNNGLTENVNFWNLLSSGHWWPLDRCEHKFYSYTHNMVCSGFERSLMTLRQLYIKRFSWQYRCYAQLSNGLFLSIA